MTPTRALGRTFTWYMPKLVSTPKWPGVRTSPGPNTVWPTVKSSPARRMWLPTGTDRATVTSAPSGLTSASSTMTTASAPGGMTAPVMMRAACPAPTVISGGTPAAIVPSMARVAGASATSADRTAKPSIAVLSNGGTSSGATTVSVVTNPRAPSTATVTSSSTVHPASTRS